MQKMQNFSKKVMLRVLGDHPPLEAFGNSHKKCKKTENHENFLKRFRLNTLFIFFLKNRDLGVRIIEKVCFQKKSFKTIDFRSVE